MQTTLVLWLALPTSAKKPKVYTTITADQVEQIVAAADHTVARHTDSVGDPLVTVEGGEFNFIVQFYDCDDGKCGTIQFRTWWSIESPIPPEAFHTYAQMQRAGRVYPSTEGDAVVETLVPLTGGVTLAHVEAMYASFLRSARTFRDLLRSQL